MKRILILGGGFGGVAAARRLSTEADGDAVEVRIVNRSNFLTYTPFLADVAGGTLAPAHAMPPIRALAPLADLEVAEVENIDPAAHRVAVRLPDGSPKELPYDYLVIALGATTSFRHGAGSADFGLPLYSVADAYLLRNRVLEMLELASASRDPVMRRELLTFVFCGGGFSGIEGAAAVEDLVHEALRYYPQLHDEPRFILAPHGDRLLEQIDERLGAYVLERFAKRKIDVRLGVGVTEVGLRSATLSTGEVVPTRVVMWAAGIDVNPLLHEVDLPKDAHGALRVGRDLKVEGHDDLFALGDCAAVPNARRRLLRPHGAERRARGPGGGAQHPRPAAGAGADPHLRLQAHGQPGEPRPSPGRGPGHGPQAGGPARLVHVARHLPGQAPEVLAEGPGRPRLGGRPVQPGRDLVPARAGRRLAAAT